MPLRLPAEFAGYCYDSNALPWFVILRRTIGGASILLWGAFLVFLFDDSPALRPIWAFLASVLSTITVGILQQIKWPCRCTRCRKVMDIVDTPVTPEENQGFLANSSYRPGPDGWLYSRSTDSDDSLGRVRVSRLAHRWYVCHSCRIYIRGMKKLVVQVDTVQP